MHYADIIIDISIEKLDKTFQYAIPDDLQDAVSIGTQVIIPFGNGGRKIKGYVIDITEEPKIDPSRIKPILGTSRDAIAVEAQLIALAAWIRRNYGCTMNQALRTVLPIKKKENIRKKKTVHLLLTSEAAKMEYNQLIARSRHSVAKERLLAALLEQGEIEWSLITGKLNVPSTAIRDFEKAGWVEIREERSYRDPVNVTSPAPKAVSLSDDQQRAIDTVLSDEASGCHKTYLLYGVTGSGKTEVYMELIAHTIAEGKSAIVLIPEIALTYQTVMRFYHRFGSLVSILNSRMSVGERFDQYERAKAGEIRIMIGPRSALFAPFSNLGMIVIDEEHEASYKSENVPRYHARETAIARAKMQDATVILGSATPSVESYSRAETGEYTLLSLPKRISDRTLPTCEIIDLREELCHGNRSILSYRLQELLADRMEKGEQSILFLNRRGLMGFVSCRACGHVIKCPHCDVSLSLHRGNQLRCHYCGYEIEAPKVCPECGSKYIGGFRAGTQMVEDVVKNLYPNARTLRMDMDTTRGKHGHEEILQAFANREADILIGTQMIVKGHDFPAVTLVGILAADMSLNSSDYRCAERTFQLLTQAAGRAGRGEIPGDVIMQTYQPEHYSIVTACAQDYASFYQEEIAYRRLLSYPPAGHMLLLHLASESEEALAAGASEVANLLRTSFPRLLLLGPSDAPIAKVADVYRKVIYLKDASSERLIEAKDAVVRYVQQPATLSRVMVSFDFDPM